MEEVNLNASTDNSVKQISKNKNIKAIIISVVCVILFIALIAFLVGGEESKEEYQITNVSLVTDYSEYLGYDASVKGTFKNVSGEDFSYVSVEYIIYDAQGNNLGTAYDNINNLQNGDTWNFNASYIGWTDVEAVSYKLVEVTCW